MRSQFLAFLLVAGSFGLGACTPGEYVPGALAGSERVAPLPQSRIQMREVDATGASTSSKLKDREGNALFLKKPAFLTTADVASVSVGEDIHNGRATLELHMTAAAAPRLLAATEARVGKRVALTMGDQVLTVATISGPFGESMQVTGLDGDGEAQRLFAEITGRQP